METKTVLGLPEPVQISACRCTLGKAAYRFVASRSRSRHGFCTEKCALSNQSAVTPGPNRAMFNGCCPACLSNERRDKREGYYVEIKGKAVTAKRKRPVKK